jgi:hypothetical protein
MDFASLTAKKRRLQKKIESIKANIARTTDRQELPQQPRQARERPLR